MSISLFAKELIRSRDGGGDTKTKELQIGGTAPLLGGDFSTFERFVREFRRLGYDHTEVWIEGTSPTLAECRRIQKVLGGMASTIHAPFVDVSLTTARDEIAKDSLSRLRDVCLFADDLGSGVVTIHPGTWPVFEPKSLAIERFVDRYRYLNESCMATVAVENLRPKQSGVQRTLIESAEDLAEVSRKCPEIGFTLDLAHAAQAAMDLVSVSHEFANQIASIHLHDVSRGGSSHRRLGSGVLNLEQVSAALVNINSATPITMELLELEDYGRSSGAVSTLL